jgi:CHAT domain-containing protein
VSTSAARRILLRTVLLACLLGCAALFVLPHMHPRRADPDTHFFPQGEVAYLAGDYDAAIALFSKSIEAKPHDARPYYRLVDSYAQKNDLAAAEGILHSMLAADPKNARAHYGLGCAALKRENPDAALAEARLAAELDGDFGYARLLEGSALNTNGRPGEALAAWAEARRLFRAAGDREGASWAENRMALVRRQRGELRAALAGFEAALRLQRETGNRAAQIVVLGNLGLTQADLGDIERAAVSFRAALALARAEGDRGNECWLLTNLSYFEYLGGDCPRAAAYADTAVRIAQGISDRETEVQGLINIATAYTGLGDPVRALSASRQAYACAESLADVRHRAGALLAMGAASLDLGRLAGAREAFARADSLYSRIELTPGAWSALVGLCEVSLCEGDTTNAMSNAERALDLFARAGHAEGEGAAALLLSELSAAQDPRRALTLASRAVALARGRRIAEALALAQRSAVRLSLGEADGAGVDAARACQLVRPSHNPQAAWFCEMALGDAVRASDPHQALACYQASIEAVESVQRNLRLEEFKAAHLERRVEPYFKAADLLASQGRVERAFEVCEKAKARALREFFAASPVSLAPRVPEAMAAATRDLDAKLRTLRATLAGVAAAEQPDEARVRSIERDIARAKTDWNDLRARVLLEDPGYAAVLPDVPPVAAGRVLTALAPDEALLEYFLGPRSSLCIVAAGDSMHAVRLALTSSEATRDVAALRAPMGASSSLTTLGFDTAAALHLRERILDPVLPYLPRIRRLVVVPDGALDAWPLEALVFEAPAAAESDTLYAVFRRARFVADRFAVRYAPSASVLHRTRNKTTAACSGVLAFGDPQDAAAALPARRAREEALAVAALLPDGAARVAAEATESSFKALAPRYRLLHVATHGTADETAPLYSSLALAPDSARTEDGALHAYEVLGLQLSVDLVTLSACGSGMGRLYEGEGILGLARCFLQAGARQALVSLWNVEDASTSILMQHFYANLAAGLDETTALARAKEALRRMDGGAGRARFAYAHPFFWAPFILTGSRAAETQAAAR